MRTIEYFDLFSRPRYTAIKNKDKIEIKSEISKLERQIQEQESSILGYFSLSLIGLKYNHWLHEEAYNNLSQ